MKISRLTSWSFRKFSHDQGVLHASSLTYYTIIATVPVLTLFLFISKLFGFRDTLYDRLLPHLSEGREVVLQFFTFANAIIAQAEKGVIAAMGSAILLLSITPLLNNLEISLNQIWKIKTSRSWFRMFTDYFFVTLVVLSFYLLSTYFVNKAEDSVIINLLPYSLPWILFTFVYFFMPKHKIPFSSSLLGGVVGGTIYLICQWIYLYFQVALLKFGAVYGSFAAVPLFLMWVQISWCIFLFGAEISYIHAKKTH